MEQLILRLLEANSQKQSPTPLYIKGTNIIPSDSRIQTVRIEGYNSEVNIYCNIEAWLYMQTVDSWEQTIGHKVFLQCHLYVPNLKEPG